MHVDHGAQVSKRPKRGQTFRKPIALLISYAVSVLSIIALGGVTQTLPAQAVGPTVNIGAIQAQMANHTPTTNNCITYGPQNLGGKSNLVGAGQEALTGHGVRDGYRCGTRGNDKGFDGLTSKEGQSVLGFTPSSVGNIAFGSPFLLGTMAHYNNPVAADGRMFSGILNVLLKGKNFSFPWTMNETANNSSPVESPSNNDITVFTSQVSSQIITLDDGLDYKLVIKGFAETNNPNAPIVNRFSTVETKKTEGYLFASLEQVRTLTVTKVVESAPAGWAGASNVTISPRSTLAGSQWNAPIVLTPKNNQGTSYSAVKKEFVVPAEELTLEETKIPAGMELSRVVCVDGEGKAIPGVSTANNIATISAVPAQTKAQLNVTCTFYNAPKLTPLKVTNTVATELTRDYPWALAKTLDTSGGAVTGDVWLEAGKSQTYQWNVSAKALPGVDRDRKVSGEIAVNNPNAGVTFTDVNLSHTVAGATSCQIKDSVGKPVTGNVQVAGNSTAKFTYLCETSSTSGNSTTTITWPQKFNTKIYTASKATAFNFASPNKVNEGVGAVVTLKDDKFGVNETLKWAEVSKFADSTYLVPKTKLVTTVNAVSGTCVDASNTAELTGAANPIEPVTIKARVCNEANPTAQVAGSLAATFERTYQWGLNKQVITPEGGHKVTDGKATVQYNVTAEEYDPKLGGYSLEGNVTLRNPNKEHALIITKIDPTVVWDKGTLGEGYDIGEQNPGNKVTCSTETVNVKLEPGAETTAHIKCVFPAGFSIGKGTALKVSGSMKADVQWTGRPVNGQGGTSGLSSGTAKLSDAFEMAVKQPQEYAQVTITDKNADKTWTVDAQGKRFTHGPTVVSITKPVAKGQCVFFENTAVMTAGGNNVTVENKVVEPQTVNPQVCDDVDPTAHGSDGSYTTTHMWDLQKSVVGDSTATVAGSNTTKFKYQVTATHTGSTVSDQKPGHVTVTNPNESGPITATLTPAEANCLVNGQASTSVDVAKKPANGEPTTQQVKVSCSDNSTQVLVNVTFSNGSKATATVEFTEAKIINGTITVYDNKTEKNTQYELGKVTHTEKTRTFTYEDGPSHGATPGTCQPYTNKAWIDGLESTQSGKAEKTVTVCSTGTVTGSTVEGSVQGSYERDYQWDIAKSATAIVKDKDNKDQTVTLDDKNGLNLKAGESKDVTYKVTATAASYKDSKHTIKGSVVITNPNQWDQDIKVEKFSTNYKDGDKELCSVDQVDGKDVLPMSIPGKKGNTPAGSYTFKYTCNIGPAETDYSTQKIEPVFTVDGKEVKVASQNVNLNTGKIDKANIKATVSDSFKFAGSSELVGDGKAPDGSPILFTDVYSANDKHQKVYEYTRKVTAPVGACLPVHNDAVLTPANLPGDTQGVTHPASTTFNICGDADMSGEKSMSGEFVRTYGWEPSKTLLTDDANKPKLDDQGRVVLNYLAQVKETAETDSAATMQGAITLGNKNDRAIKITMKDTLLGKDGDNFTEAALNNTGLACVIKDGKTIVDGKATGAVVQVAANTDGTFSATMPARAADGTQTKVVFDYTCALPADKQTYTGPKTLKNQVVVSWDGLNGDKYGTDQPILSPETTLVEKPVDKTIKLVDVPNSANFQIQSDKDWTIDRGKASGGGTFENGVHSKKITLRPETAMVPGTCLTKAAMGNKLVKVQPTLEGETPVTPQSTDPSWSTEIKDSDVFCRPGDFTTGTNATDGDFQRRYDWTLAKTVDGKGASTKWAEAGAQSGFEYQVTAKPSGYSDNLNVHDGTVTVANPDNYRKIKASVALDVPTGMTCELRKGDAKVDGPIMLEASASATLNVVCSELGTADTKAIKATISYTDADGNPLLDGSGNLLAGKATTMERTVSFIKKASLNETIKVSDDLANKEWEAKLGTTSEPQYSLSHKAEAGKCLPYHNTAKAMLEGFGKDGQGNDLGIRAAHATANVCNVDAASTGDNDELLKHDAQFTRTYKWDIAKEITNGVAHNDDPRRFNVTGDGKAQIDYKVTVTKKGTEDKDASIVGAVKISNPADEAVQMGVVATFAGKTCQVKVLDGHGTNPIAAKSSTYFEYRCEGLAKEDYTTTGSEFPKVTIAVTPAGASGPVRTLTQPVPFRENKIDDTVQVQDLLTDHGIVNPKPAELTPANGAATTLVYGEAAETTPFSYRYEATGKPHECYPVNNVASLMADNAKLKEAEAPATVCSDGATKVTKDATATLTRSYGWDLAKKYTGGSVDPNTGQATVNYDVTATRKDINDSSWQMSGTITVANPNGRDITVENIVDQPMLGDTALKLVGDSCTTYRLDKDGKPDHNTPVKGSVIAAKAELKFGYQCQIDPSEKDKLAPIVNANTITEKSVANKAIVTWTGHAVDADNKPVHNTDSWTLESTPTKPFTFVENNTTGKNITLVEDNTTAVIAGPEKAMWADADKPVVWHVTDKPVEKVKAGECGKGFRNSAHLADIDHNNAKVGEGALADTTSSGDELCRPADPTVNVGGEGQTDGIKASYDRTYKWDLAKTAEPAKGSVVDKDKTVHVESGKSATINYTVTPTQNGYSDNNHTVTTTVKVTNPNNWKPINVKQAENKIGDKTCTRTDKVTEIKASETGYLSFTCSNVSVQEADYAKKIESKVTVDIDGKTLAANQLIEFKLAGENHKQATITDSQEALKDNVRSWDKIGAAFSYTKQITPEAGKCVIATNKAEAKDGDVALTKPAETNTKVCAHLAPVIGDDSTKPNGSATASYHETYGWELAKAATDKAAVVNKDGKPEIGYTLTVTETDAEQANHSIQGMFQIKNPNSEPLTINSAVIKLAGKALECTDVTGVVAGDSKTDKSFTCKLPAGYKGTVKEAVTAELTWTDALGEHVIKPEIIKGEPQVTPFQKTIKVTEQPTATDKDGKSEWEFVWSEKGKQHVIDVTDRPDDTMELGTCRTFGNKASMSVEGKPLGEPKTADALVCLAIPAPDVDSLLNSASAGGEYDRDYKWAIRKDANKSSSVSGDEVNYRITVTGESTSDTGHKIKGVFGLTNPNTDDHIASIKFDINHIGLHAEAGKDNASRCTIDGEATSFTAAPGVTVPVAFTCAGDDLAALTRDKETGEVKADIYVKGGWNYVEEKGKIGLGGAPSEHIVPIESTIPVAWQENATNKTVTITDNMVDLSQLPGGNKLTWKRGEQTINYSRTLTVTEQMDVSNIATIKETGQSSEHKVNVAPKPSEPAVIRETVQWLARTGSDTGIAGIMAAALAAIIGASILIRKRRG